MYLIKSITLTENSESVFVAKDGMNVYAMTDPIKLGFPWGFWGPTEVICNDDFDLSVLPKAQMKHEVYLTYANSYEVSDVGNGNREIKFFVGKYDPDNIEGYILFVDKVIGSIRTNGQKVGGKYNNEIVVVLREGRYLQIEEPKHECVEFKTAEVMNGELILTIHKV